MSDDNNSYEGQTIVCHGEDLGILRIQEPSHLTHFNDANGKVMLTIDGKNRRIFAGENVEVTAAAQQILDALELLLGAKI